MADYKAQYFALFRAMEDAISILIEAQQKAEEAIISEQEPIFLLPRLANDKDLSDPKSDE